MPDFLKAVTTLIAALLLTFALPAAALAQDDQWRGMKGKVNAGVSGSGARIEATDQTRGGGLAGWTGDQAAPLEDDSGHNPWARYTLVTDPSGKQQLCTTVNAGQAGVDGNRVRVCYDATRPDLPDGPVATDPAALAAQAVAQLSVPAPEISISPHPSDNKWNLLAVGLPIWVWAEDPGPITTSVSEQGIDIQMQANRGSVTFDWGDGTHSVCNLMRPRPATMDPLTPSPDCGHTYLKKGDYTITATAGWAVSWQTLGQTGALPVNSTSTIEVPIREFSAVVVG